MALYPCHSRRSGNPGSGRMSEKQYQVYVMASKRNGTLTREKQLKKWERASKIRLIEENNPRWEDLYPLLG